MCPLNDSPAYRAAIYFQMNHTQTETSFYIANSTVRANY